MKPTSDSASLTIPPALLAEIEAEAQKEHRPAADMLQDVVVCGLEKMRALRTLVADRDAILTSLDEAEASLDRGEGIPITQASMRQLAEEVKRRGRARLAVGLSATELKAIAATEMNSRHDHLNAELLGAGEP